MSDPHAEEALALALAKIEAVAMCLKLIQIRGRSRADFTRDVEDAEMALTAARTCVKSVLDGMTSEGT